MSHWYNYFSWWWAQNCPKHVENRNKHIRKIVHHVGFIYKIIQGCTVNRTINRMWYFYMCFGCLQVNIFTSVWSFKENLSGFFPWDLPVVKISPEWVTGPEQCNSSGRIATFSLWTSVFRDGIFSIPDETVIPLWLGRHFLIYENRVYHEKVRMTVG